MQPQHWRKLAGALVFIYLAVMACSSSTSNNNGNNNGGNSNLTVSNATPVNGDGAVASLAVVVDTVPLGPPQGDAVEMVVSGNTGGVLQQVDIMFLLSDNSVLQVEHKWGADLLNPDGFTICATGGGFTPCAPAQVTADAAAQQVVMTGLALDAATGDGDASTLDGTINY